MSVAIVGAGSNLGARESSIFTAAALIAARPHIEVTRTSPLYETRPVGPPQADYLNAAFRLETELPPPALLQTVLRIEARLNRRRRTDLRWGPRSVDLDILWDSRGAFHSPELHVPHRELERRSFALAPLLDVAPELAFRYAGVLDAIGGRPAPWSSAPVIRQTVASSVFERQVEALTIADACASSVRIDRPYLRPWGTRHVLIPASFTAFSATVRQVFRSGFQCCCTTISNCSQSQWSVEFHGANCGMAVEADVRLETTSDDSRPVRAVFRAILTRHE